MLLQAVFLRSVECLIFGDSIVIQFFVDFRKFLSHFLQLYERKLEQAAVFNCLDGEFSVHIKSLWILVGQPFREIKDQWIFNASPLEDVAVAEVLSLLDRLIILLSFNEYQHMWSLALN